MDIKLKHGVRLRGVSPEMVMGFVLAVEVLRKHGHRSFLSSVTDGKHMSNSRHHCGQAVDIDLLEHNTDEIASDMRGALGPDFDVVNEGSHIHIEYDPKSGG